MTIRQVLKQNKNITVLDDGFRVFTIPFNNFIVNTDGTVYLRTDAHGDYKATVQSTKDMLDKLPQDLPDFLQTPWSLSQHLSDEQAEELTTFITKVYAALE